MNGPVKRSLLCDSGFRILVIMRLVRSMRAVLDVKVAGPVTKEQTVPGAACRKPTAAPGTPKAELPQAETHVSLLPQAVRAVKGAVLRDLSLPPHDCWQPSPWQNRGERSIWETKAYHNY